MSDNKNILWLYGLSGSGKTTICNELKSLLENTGQTVSVLDGDLMRATLSKDLGFSQKDRTENLKRASKLALKKSREFDYIICTFITPLISQREMIKENCHDKVQFIFIGTSLDQCISRDPKGLYKKAINGEIKEFTGISSEFEIGAPNLTIETSNLSPLASAKELLDQLN